MDQLGIPEHGGDCLGALHADSVITKPAERGQGAACRKCSWGVDILAGNRGGNAAHMSSFSDSLPLMQLAMMITDSMPSPLPERSIFSVGLVPLSSSIGSG